MSQCENMMVEAIDQKIGVKAFYSTRELVNAGVFGSLCGVRRAMQAGRLAYVQISPRRLVILRKELLSFLQDNYAGGQK